MEKESEKLVLNSKLSYGREVLILLFRLDPRSLPVTFEGILAELARIQYGTDQNNPERGQIFMANGFGRYDAMLILECPDYRIANRMRHIEGIKKSNSHLAFLWNDVNPHIIFTPQELVEHPLITITSLKIENHLILAGGHEIECEILHLLKRQLDRIADSCRIKYDIMSTLSWSEVIVALAASDYDSLGQFPLNSANISIDSLIENIQEKKGNRKSLLSYLNECRNSNYKSLFSRTFSINGFLTELVFDYIYLKSK